MKLPEDKNERNKIFALIGIGVVAILVAIIFMPGIGVQALSAAKKDKLAKIAALKTKCDAAEKEVNGMEALEKRLMDTLTKTKDLSDQYVLAPQIGGNYKLNALAVVERAAQKVGVKLTPGAITESGGVTEFPQISPKDPPRNIKLYTIRVSTRCGFADFYKLIAAIEGENPLLCISGVDIKADPLTPAAHDGSFNVQWPVWADSEHPLKLEGRLAELAPEQPKQEVQP